MKKVLSFISALALVTCAFVSCGDKEDSGSSSKEKKSKSEKGIVGTWVPSGDTLEEMKEDLGGGMTVENVELVITETEISINASVNASDMFCLTDDSFKVDGQAFDYEYDGKVITISAEGQTITEFDRMDVPDENNIYGKYTNDDLLGGSGDEASMYYDFVESGVSYMVMSQKEEYTYDEKTSKLTTNASGETIDGEYKVDGDTLTITDEDGKVETFARAD